MQQKKTQATKPSSADHQGPGQAPDEAGSLDWRRGCGAHGACVEVAKLPDGRTAVRDGKSADGSPVLVFSSEEWRAFLVSARAGDFD